MELSWSIRLPSDAGQRMVWLRLGSGRDIGHGRSFGISWLVAVSLRKPPIMRFDFLGFPWILSSESRLFNGLRWILREENFSRPFAARQRAGAGAGILTMQKRSVAHRASLTRFLLFCNQERKSFVP